MKRSAVYLLLVLLVLAISLPAKDRGDASSQQQAAQKNAKASKKTSEKYLKKQKKAQKQALKAKDKGMKNEKTHHEATGSS